MKHLILIGLLFFVGCKAAIKGGDKSYFDKNHTPFLDAPALFLTSGDNLGVDSILLEWAESKGADYYIIKYKKTSETEWTIAGTIERPPYSLRNLQTNTAYDVMVIAKNQVGEMSSNVVTMTTLLTSQTPGAVSISIPSFNEGVESIINLPYSRPGSDLASGCEVSEEFNVTVTRACQCDNVGVCTVGVTGAYQYSGPARFKYRVMIGQHASNFETVSFNIAPVNDAPTISSISQVVTNEDSLTSFNFSINDPDSGLTCTSSHLMATSTNAGLIPVSSITFGGTYPNCTASFTPGPNAYGSSDLAITVSDGSLTATSNTFTVTVNAVNDAPVVSPIAAVSTSENTPKTINFSISDIESTLSCTGNVTVTSSNLQLIRPSDMAVGGSAPNCTLTLSPILYRSGEAQVTVSVSDGTFSTSSTFNFTVAHVNNPPTIGFLTNSTMNEDTTSVVNFTINDTDSTLACNSSFLSAASSDPTVVMDMDVVFGGTYPNCTASITPVGNAFGSTNITISVTDGSVTTTSNSFTLTVNSVNDAPGISSVVAQSTSQDTPQTVNFTINDVDSVLTCSGNVSGSSSNTAIVATSGMAVSGNYPNCLVTLTPVSGASGAVTLTLTVSDGSLSSTSAFSFYVSAVNAAPTISALSNTSMSEDGSQTLNFTVTDPDSTISCSAAYLSATSTSTALLDPGSVVFGGTSPNCTATLSPSLNAFGTTTMTIVASDGVDSRASNSFVLTVNAVNDTPTISSVPTQNMAPNQSTTVNFTLSDVDSSLDCVSSMSATSSNAALVDVSGIVFGGTFPNCSATITPVTNQSGASTIALIVSDTNTTQSTSFTVTFTSNIIPPVANSITPASFAEDVQSIITLSYSDSQSALASSCFISNLSHVNVTQACACNVAGVCTVGITGASDYYGSASFSYTVTANNFVSNSAQASLTIAPVNDAPSISALSAQSVAEDTVKVVNFTIADIDSSLTCSGSVSAASSNAALVGASNITITGVAPNCTASINPLANQNGSATITFTVSDGSLIAATSFALTVTPVNDAPTMSAIAAQTTNEDTAKVVNFTINDVDSTITCSGSVSASSSNTSIVSNDHVVFAGTYPNCTATISPSANQFGNLNLTFTVSDGALSASRTFALTVAPIDDAPVISTIAAQSTNEDVAKSVSFTITDIDSTLTCSGSVSATSSNSGLITSANVNITGTAPNCVASLTPTLNQSGTSTITLTVSDGTLSSQSAFSFSVNAINDAPIIGFIANDTGFEDTAKIIHFTLSDVDSTLNCSSSYLSAASSNHSIVLSTDIVFGGTYPNCTATISLLSNMSGLTNITITATDGIDSTTSNAFSLNFSAVNDAPTMSTIMAQSTNEDVVKNVSFTINDIDSTLTCSGSVTSSVSDASLVSSVVVSGTYPNCNAAITPALNKTGVVTITLTTSDGSLNVSSSFALTLNAVNDAPTIAAISNQTMNEDSSLVVNFTIDDIDSALTCTGRVTGSSSNTGILANAGIVIGGTYPNCTATLTPLANQNGAVTVTLSVTDGGLSANSAFTLTVNAIDDAPVASNISSVNIDEDIESIVTLPYIDLESNQAASCSVSALNKVTITRACACSAGVCTVGVTGISDYNGSAGFSFNVTANSLTSNTATAAFTINAINDAPTMGSISSQVVAEDSSLNVNFTVTDVDSSLNCATSVTGSSSNQSIVGNGNITFSGSAPNCVATIAPISDQNGTVNITLTVNDGSLSAQRTFSLLITPALDIGGSVALTGVADPLFARTLGLTGLTVDEAVSKVEVCLSEDVNLNGSISAGEKCNTQNWIDVTAKIGASGSSSPSLWSSYTIKNGVDGASFVSNLAPTCTASRSYVLHVRMTSASVGVTAEVNSSAWTFWSPSCLGVSVGLWLDASANGVLYSDTNCTVPAVSGVAGGVACWRDKVNASLSINASVLGGPKYDSAGWSGGKPALIFNGAQDLVKYGINLNPKNIIVVSKVTSNGASEGIFGNLATDFGIRINTAGGWVSSLLGYTGSDFTFSGGVSYVNGTSGGGHNLAEHILYQTKGDHILPLGGNWPSIGIGGYQLLGSKRINANIAEIIVCTTECGSAQTKLEGYLAHKWGLSGSLSVGHSYKTTPP